MAPCFPCAMLPKAHPVAAPPSALGAGLPPQHYGSHSACAAATSCRCCTQVLSLPTSEVEDVGDVLEKVADLGTDATGEQLTADGLELWTQDAQGHAKRVRESTPFKHILGAHALLARTARDKNHMTRATLD